MESQSSVRHNATDPDIATVYIGEHVSVIFPRRPFQIMASRFNGVIVDICEVHQLVYIQPKNPYTDAWCRLVKLKNVYVWRGKDGDYHQKKGASEDVRIRRWDCHPILRRWPRRRGA